MMQEDPALLGEFLDLDPMLFGMLSMTTCRSHMGRRKLIHAAHISHDVLPIASLSRRHVMSDAPCTPQPPALVKYSRRLPPSRR